MRRKKLTKGTLSSIVILFIIICIIAILISVISSIFTFLSNYKYELIIIGIAILSIFIVVKLIGNLTKNNNGGIDEEDDEEKRENLDYIINLSTNNEEREYTYPILENDYKNRIEHINSIIQDIENKQYIKNTFIQKENYKIRYKDELNEQQLDAVQTINNPLLIIAGAGTGKTKTLSYRVSYMIENGINQEDILLLTFTRKASKEMLYRTKKLLELKTININGGTFHSFANNILRKYYKLLNIKAHFNILDTVDSADVIDLIKRELKLNKIDGKPIPKKATIQKIISMAKNFRKSIEEIILLKYPNLIDFIYHIDIINSEYIKYNKNHHLYDYDDLLEQLYICLRDNIQFKNIIQNKYKYIMVDEFQDTNIVQKLIIVPETYPDCKIIKLEKNYRSNQGILDFTNDIVNNFNIGYRKKLHSDNNNNIIPILKRLGNQEDEAEYIKNEIVELYHNGIRYKDVAILYRSTFHANYVEKAFIINNIPYEMHGGIKFIERKHIRDMISYLRILLNPFDAVAWNRILLLLENIGNATASKIIREIENNNGNINFQAFSNNKYYNELVKLENVLKENMSDSIPVYLKIENINKYYAPILKSTDNEADKRLLDMDVLISMSKEYEYNLEKFLSDFTLEPPNNSFMDAVRPAQPEDDCVTLSTIHSAKGLEWKYIFIIHLIDGLFPNSFAIQNIETLEEERRLFYVATTRAKTKLTLTMPSYFASYNAFLQLPSRFVNEINENKYIKEL
ncbi:ATP-dependent helicase [Brachyspira aalborgi]|uniref:DNA 3'-5' helicase n=1 Tax=Brachyspira aalborgi TaxID=29522 RepID=A0A5C8FTQ2_9SPIR|nr:ATP-dependent helicase [Brachyspira aalborgi]